MQVLLIAYCARDICTADFTRTRARIPHDRSLHDCTDAEIDDEILVCTGAEYNIQVCVEAHLRSLSSWFLEQVCRAR